MRRRLVLFTAILLGIAFCGGLCGLGWYRIGIHPTPFPERDIVFQVYGSNERGKLGWVNADGSGKIVLSPARYERFDRYTLRLPFLTRGILGFLSNEPHITESYGTLTMIYHGKALSCRFWLDWQPSPVGKESTIFVGKYEWFQDGGAVLFQPLMPGCPSQPLWSAEELEAMGVVRITGFHTRPALLLTGEQAYVWDLEEQTLQPLEWLPPCVGKLSPDDRLLMCVRETTSGMAIEVWNMESHQLQQQRPVPATLVPYYAKVEGSWSPDGQAIVYHRCVEPDYDFCEEKRRDNTGIYIWELATDRERLVTTGGIFPYWIDREEMP